MSDARTLPKPETHVELRCPLCKFAWHAADVLPGAWWGRSVTPTAIARLSFCPNCDAPPPMWVINRAEGDDRPAPARMGLTGA